MNQTGQIARLIEIFSSIQGEGLWLGKPQVFVRFKGCKLHCSYCDTPLTHMHITESRIEEKPYNKNFIKRPLEWNKEKLNDVISSFRIPSLALTGGEPLEQVDFLESWLPEVYEEYEILLETSGVEVDALKRILPFLGMVSMDIKIPSATKEDALWEVHDAFLLQAKLKPCYAKIVFNEKITNDEIEHVMMLAQKHNVVNFIFQPVSPIQKTELKRCFEVFQIFSEKFPHRVRFIPQVHKFLGIL